MMSKESSTKIVNFISFGAGFILKNVQIVHAMKMHNFFSLSEKETLNIHNENSSTIKKERTI